MLPTKRVALYVRVSKHDQTTENQLPELQQFCAARGWEIVATFDEPGISGAKKSRPELDKCMAFVRARRCDCLLVWRFDRFARSLSHLVLTLEELRELRVDFASVRNGTDTTTSQGKLLFGINALFAEYERDVIRERVMAGLARVRAAGQRLGRPPQLSNEQRSAILSLLGKASVRQIAARVGVSKSVAQRVLYQNPKRNASFVTDETPVDLQGVP